MTVSVLDQVRIVIYRVHEKGLEVILVQPKLDNDPSVWRTLESEKNADINRPNNNNIIKLDTIKQADGSKIHTYAVEENWVDIPSVRGIIKHDVQRLKDKILKIFPEVEEGSFLVVKEAFKRVLPYEYAALKELRDILRDRNSVKYI